MNDSALPTIPLLPHIAGVVGSAVAFGSAIGYVVNESANRDGPASYALSTALIGANCISSGSSVAGLIHAMRANNSSEAMSAIKSRRTQ